MNIIIPKYSFAVRHPVYDALQIDTRELILNPELQASLEAQLGTGINSVGLGGTWLRAVYKFKQPTNCGQQVDYLVNLAGPMLDEYNALIARGCHNLVLVHHVNGHSFAIGNV